MTKPAGYLIETRGLREGIPGVFYNYVLAANGLFIQAQNEHLAGSVCIAPAEVRGLDPLQEYVQMRHGKIPMHFLSLALSVLCIKPDIEQYVAVTWHGSYHLAIPTQSQTAGSVTYETLPGTVLDIHSHVAGVPARFSGTDNYDDQGFCLYAVVGDLQNLFPTMELRLGVYGYFMPLKKDDIFV